VLRQSPHWQAAHALRFLSRLAAGCASSPCSRSYRRELVTLGSHAIAMACIRTPLALVHDGAAAIITCQPAIVSCTHPDYMTTAQCPPQACSMRPAAVHGARKGPGLRQCEA
jgi:hypothetical protein